MVSITNNQDTRLDTRPMYIIEEVDNTRVIGNTQYEIWAKE